MPPGTGDAQSRPPDTPAAESRKIDVLEHSRDEGGRPITSNRRLFMQLVAYGGCGDTTALVDALGSHAIQGALYEDVSDPGGVALLTFSENPAYFVDDVRRCLRRTPFAGLVPKPEYTMFGRTYALGHEPDLVEALILRPIRRVLDPKLAWVIWYPLRRAGSFEQLTPKEQSAILMEHGGIGRAYGKAGYLHDVRMACHGLDQHDNDFLIGLLGPELFPLSSCVQRMRRTRQTSLHLERLGPFFVGRVAWQSAAPAP
ncbi:MAG: chlorite dismutase family protein [Acidimicrobiia bacterium]|nr:chlorite dismutase family protein [Acidimicrobiia bacterium]